MPRRRKQEIDEAAEAEVLDAPMTTMGEDISHDLVAEYIPKEEYERVMQAIEDNAPRGGVSRIMTRAAVAGNLMAAFEVSGGVSRLAAILQRDDDKFYAFSTGPYARLAPNAQHDPNTQGKEVVIKHVVPRTALDE